MAEECLNAFLTNFVYCLSTRFINATVFRTQSSIVGDEISKSSAYCESVLMVSGDRRSQESGLAPAADLSCKSAAVDYRW